MMNFKRLLTATLLLPLFICTSLQAESIEDQRQEVIQMRDGVLADLYKLNPTVRGQIDTAPGYAVFNNANVNLLVASFGGGFGVVTDTASGKNTYMKMAEVGIGLGAGVKDFKVVFIFHHAKTMHKFINEGWAFGAQVDAAAKAGDKGGALAGEAVIDDITVYQLTESGLALQATVKGTKYWADDDLN